MEPVSFLTSHVVLRVALHAERCPTGQLDVRVSLLLDEDASGAHSRITLPSLYSREPRSFCTKTLHAFRRDAGSLLGKHKPCVTFRGLSLSIALAFQQPALP